MFYAQATNGPRVEIKNDADSLRFAHQASWLDLFQPTAEERHLAESIIGLQLPDRADLEEVETSSRLYTEYGAVFMSTPLLTKQEEPTPLRSPLGFVLTKGHLVTIRYAAGLVFDAVSERFAKHDETPCSGVHTMVALVEAMVDREADVLERVGGLLDGISTQLFTEHENGGKAASGRTSREQLQAISRAGDVLSGLRDSLLGLTRIVGYVPEAAQEWMTPAMMQHFVTLRSDLTSLADYQTRLQDKTQFLLDATLGFINIDQNEIFRILTVVSVVGIPPTLVAGIYGMNFKNMPELGWSYGYLYGLVVILLSGLVPLWLFHRRGWV